jgi:Kef-type K+ transport system membrane component KefB/nucleotide-binding universal stress UspA family protein
VKSRYFPVVLILALLSVTRALAAPGGGSIGGSAEVVLVAQVALLLLVGRGLGELLQRLGQPAVIGQLLAGLILGPSLFGWLWPQAHHLIFPGGAEQKNLITGIADMGVMMLLLLTGMETDLKLVRKVGMPAIAVTITGVAVPFVCGIALGLSIPATLLPNPEHRLVAALFIGIALSISSIKIVAMVVREMNFMRRNLGQIIVASAIMEDTIGWIILAIIVGIAGADGLSWASLTKTMVGTALFLVLSYTVGRKLVFWLIRWVNDSFASEYAVITAILIVMLVMAMITQGLGVNTVLGAFVAGVLVGESPILSQQIESQLRGFITAFMMPVFFGLSGLSADLTIFKDATPALFTLGLVAIASLGKFGGAFAGGRISGLSARESLAVGSAMNARGSTEVIIATIGLSVGALTQNLYTMIVTMAIVTTMTMPPMLRWALRRLPMSEEEKARLEKEDLDARGFVSRFERLLVAADEGVNGRFASSMAGFIAGQRGLPVTMVQIGGMQAQDSPLAEAAMGGAKQGHRFAQEEKGEEKPGKVQIVTRRDDAMAEAIAREAPKGYDLLFVGVEDMRDSEGRFIAAVEDTAKAFTGPLALVLAGRNGGLPYREGLNILVAVNGTDASRRGAEMAFAISPSHRGQMTALHIADRMPPEPPGMKRGFHRLGAHKKIGAAVLDDVTELARRYGYGRIRAAVQIDVAPDAAILEEAEKHNTDRTVIGASRRVGERLYLGQTVTRILRQWKGALLLVVT